MAYGFTELGGQPASFPPQPGMEAPAEPFFPEADDVELMDEGEGMPIWLRWAIFFVAAFGIIWLGFYVFSSDDEEGLVLTPAPSETQQSIIGIKGGELSLSDGAKIIVPRGALDRDMRFEIERFEKPGAATDLYHFKPDSLILKKAVTVMIPYRAGDSGIVLYHGDSKENLGTALNTYLIPNKNLAEARLNAL